MSCAERFACFGGECAVLVDGSGPAGSAAQAVHLAKKRLLDWHAQFSRFEPDSELSRLNADPRETVPVSAVMARFVEAAVDAAELTGGLVDPTLTPELERAGYDRHLEGPSIPVATALTGGSDRAPARADPAARWRRVRADRRARTVTRPLGVKLDGGGILKGLFGDLLAVVLGRHQSFAVDASGDVRLGGTGLLERPVEVASPLDGSVLHTFGLSAGAVATSGITRRSWLDRDGRPAHHLLDPASGMPAFTGVIQATALAPTAVAAEALSKAALLTGSRAAARWLPHGGLVVHEGGRVELIDGEGR